MAVPAQRYTAGDKDAMVALSDSGLTGAQVKAELELNGYPPLNVKPHGAGSLPLSSVRAIIGRRRKQRAAETFSDLSRLPTADATAELRRRLITICERETKILSTAAVSGKADLAKVDRLASILLKLSSSDRRTAQPSSSPPAEQRSDFERQLETDASSAGPSEPPTHSTAPRDTAPTSLTAQPQPQRAQIEREAVEPSGPRSATPLSGANGSSSSD